MAFNVLLVTALTLTVIGVVVLLATLFLARTDPRDPKNMVDHSRSIDASIRERFTTDSSSVIHPKNNTYFRYFKTYFSRDVANDNSVMFYPSVIDVACKTMSDSLNSNLECDNAYADSVSIQDTDVKISLSTGMTCESMAMARAPIDPKDATVRLMDGMYVFLKTCVRIPYSGLSRKDESDTEFMLDVSSEDPAITFVVLNRPIFMMVNGSKLYQLNNLGSFTSGADVTHTLMLNEVTDATVWPSSRVGFDRSIDEIYDDVTTGEQMMNCTFYYLRYQGPVRIGIEDAQFQYLNVISLCFQLHKSRMTSSNNWVEFTQTEHGVNLTVSYSSSAKTVSISVNGESYSTTDVPDDGDGYYVLTISTDLMIACYMSRNKVKLEHNALPNAVRVPRTQKASVDQHIRSKDAVFPVICFPNDNFGIPNFNDLYKTLVSFS